jgi:DNA-binding XRE family transcriptional regulator
MADRPEFSSAADLRRRRAPNRAHVQEIKRTVRLDIALDELRSRRGETQERVAARLSTSRPNVSRIEHESDIRLSTLVRYVAALGGELELVARFEDGESYTILKISG